MDSRADHVDTEDVRRMKRRDQTTQQQRQRGETDNREVLITALVCGKVGLSLW